MSNEQKCRDCGVLEGGIHEHGCDNEACPECGGQLIACDCCYEFLKVDVSPGTWAYNNGLTDEQEELYIAELNRLGRTPYFLLPNLCMRCGAKWPEMFKVTDEEWQSVVAPRNHRGMLCRPCFDEMRALLKSARENILTPEGE